MMRSYAIIGTGALGGFYGAKLQRAGLDVHFLVNSDYHHIKTHGLRIKSKDGDFDLPQVAAYRHSNELPICDVILICLKTTHNHLLSTILADIVTPNSVILVLQNGLGTEPEIRSILNSISRDFTEDRPHIMGGLCFICSNKTAPGQIEHLDYGQIKLGAYLDNYQAAGINPLMEEIAGDFDSAGIPVSLCDHLFLARWQKLVWNIPYNGLSVVLNATTDRLMADPHTRALIERLMGEIQLVANAYSCPISDEFIQTMLDYTVKMTPYRTSMKIDYDTGRPLEIQAMFGNPLEYARIKGIDLPSIAMLERQLKFLDRQICQS